ncbi:MAG: diguanylate cyclase [Clostridia bacterium]|nr:diguanylate cyclase [Clostridia bacterium]
MRSAEKTDGKGLSLRLTFFVMFILSLAVTFLLLLTTYRTLKSFYGLSKAVDDYIELEESASDLLRASDYLTEEAQNYTVLYERKYLDNYFREAEQTRRRENAVQRMESALPQSAALNELKTALQESVSLMQREYYAMLLVLEATGDEDIPVAMKETTLSQEDAALSSEEKKALAARLMHDEEYFSRKEKIRAHFSQCISELKSGTHGVQTLMRSRTRKDLSFITVMIIIQSAGLLFMLVLTLYLGIKPLLKAVEHIKKDQRLPVIGANEFRYLAGTYNKMYSAYKRSIESLSYKAYHDELTDLYNRAGYDLIKRGVEPSSTAVLMVDVDSFKQLNDSHGHEKGDLALKRVAEVLKANFRSDDYVCRLGGDEFVVLMVHVDKDSRELIEKKIERIREDLKAAEGETPVTVSVGVSYCRETDDIQKMFREADIALYRVKENGRNGYRFYEDGPRKEGSD